MAASLRGKRIAILATDGVEQVELDSPRGALAAAGARTELISPKAGSIQGVNHDRPGDHLVVDRTLDEASAGDYDALLLPGGVANPDSLRTDRRAINFVRAFFESDKPVAAICHGPWLLVEADVLRGRTVTSWPSLRTDIRNAGGSWVDEEVRVDQNLVTSRRPADLPAFNAAVLREFARSIADRSSEDKVDNMLQQSFPASDPLPGPSAVGGEGARAG